MKFFPNCINCGYLLRGLTGSFKCPACAFEYDHDTQAWTSPYGAFHFANNIYVSVVAVIWVALAGALNLMVVIKFGRGVSSTVRLVTHLISLIILLYWLALASRSRKRSLCNPFVALAPSGILINKTGRPGNFRTITWDQARNDLAIVGDRWDLATGVRSKLGIALKEEDVRQIFHSIKRRIGSPLLDISNARGSLKGMDTTIVREPDRL